MKRPAILVIDDEVSHFDVIEALFNRQNYQLYYAGNGEDAIGSLDAFNPDLILLDVLMPGSNGIEVCRRIKSLPQWQSVPIIVLTILDTKTTFTSCINAGADDFITKPFDSRDLRARVNSMLKLKQQHDKNQILSRIQTNAVNLLEGTLNELRGSLDSHVSHDDLLNRIEQSARRLENLTAKFQIYMELELAANQPGTWQTDESQSLMAAMATVETLAQKYNRSNDLTLMIEDAEVPILARYLSIILYELVDNALKFSLPETLIEVSSEVLGDFVTVSVHDAGQGMPEEQVATIEEAIEFKQQVYRQQDTEMGLKIVKRIVELVGGSFFLKSIYLEGTTVTFTLPIVGN